MEMNNNNIAESLVESKQNTSSQCFSSITHIVTLSCSPQTEAKGLAKQELVRQ